MPNKRIRKKREVWRKPLREIVISEAEAQTKMDRILQRLRRHHECYIVERANGKRVVIAPHRWVQSARQHIADQTGHLVDEGTVD